MTDAPEQSDLHTLHRASGSATYVLPSSSSTSSPLTITCGVNFPVEVPRRSDELPTQLLIDVNVRPARGVGQVRERHVESLVQRTLAGVILREDWPRMACQVGLQIVSGEEEGSDGSYLALLAGCLNAAFLGCLDAGVPMRTVVGATLVGIRNKSVVLYPDLKERAKCTSLHVFAFSRNGECLLMESEGRCSLVEWEKLVPIAKNNVVKGDQDSDLKMDGDVEVDVMTIMKRSVEARVARDERWMAG